MMLAARNLGKTVISGNTELVILNNINLELAAGDSLAITGASGSGKSTLLGLLAGLDLPTAGEVLLDSQSLSSLSEDQRALRRAQLVGFVFQSFQLLPGLSALENVMLPLELRGDNDAEAVSRQLLVQVGLSDRVNHRIAQLSGGEQQRVAIARAFACRPRILFADEPTGNLDARTGQQIIELLFDLNREHGTTLVFVTHEQRLAQLCSRQLALEGGSVVTAPASCSEEVCA